MTDALRHRGPDAGGTWTDVGERIALGHRRLSILDLSAAGAQPMHSGSGRYVITYNGEIYNFRALRSELEQKGVQFVGHSDTEVLLASIEAWGLSQALQRINGMYAFGLWDRKARELSLVRDRVGKKPLYYGWFGDSFLFGSELKALRRHQDFNDDLDIHALGDFAVSGWISLNRSIFRNVKKLPPGGELTVRAGDRPWSRKPRRYWSARALAEACEREPYNGSLDGAVKDLQTLLSGAVSDRMVADVDLGALLSGGIDSSTIVALMQSVSDRPVKTFSIGFTEPKYNEAEYARAVARHLGTEHYDLYVTPQQALDVVPKLSEIYDEPFADPSQIPTSVICALARERVSVVLTGDGGDELFGGYNRYARVLRWWNRVRRLPRPVGSYVGRLSGWMHDFGAAHFVSAALPERNRLPKYSKFFSKRGRDWCFWQATDPRQILSRDLTNCLSPGRYIESDGYSNAELVDVESWADVADPLKKLLQFDFIGWLPDDVLVKVDRASMAVGLEARSPLLDPNVLRLAWSLPTEFLRDDAGGKKIMRELLGQYIPRHLIERPKRGFNVPVSDWLRGPLRDWAEGLLAEGLLREQGIFDGPAIRKAWQEHLCGWQKHSRLLWSVLMFQSWSR
jgi:asparagine synthase (glutamine-hydrolysing)